MLRSTMSHKEESTPREAIHKSERVSGEQCFRHTPGQSLQCVRLDKPRTCVHSFLCRPTDRRELVAVAPSASYQKPAQQSEPRDVVCIMCLPAGSGSSTVVHHFSNLLPGAILDADGVLTRPPIERGPAPNKAQQKPSPAPGKSYVSVARMISNAISTTGDVIAAARPLAAARKSAEAAPRAHSPRRVGGLGFARSPGGLARGSVVSPQ